MLSILNKSDLFIDKHGRLVFVKAARPAGRVPGALEDAGIAAFCFVVHWEE